MDLFTNFATAEIVNCDWKSIKHNVDETYTYSKPLHLCVGKLVYNQTLDNQQIDDLTKATKELNLALDKADQQSQIWQTEATTLRSKIDEIEQHERSKNWIIFGLGFLTASAAIYATSRIAH